MADRRTVDPQRSLEQRLRSLTATQNSADRRIRWSSAIRFVSLDNPVTLPVTIYGLEAPVWTDVLELDLDPGSWLVVADCRVDFADVSGIPIEDQLKLDSFTRMSIETQEFDVPTATGSGWNWMRCHRIWNSEPAPFTAEIQVSHSSGNSVMPGESSASATSASIIAYPL